MKTQMQVILM